jgi:uncharacterized delta-60 repeat protein
VAAAHAGVGRLDPSYGARGIASTPLGTAGFDPEVELTVDGGEAFVGDGDEGNAVSFRPNGSRDMGLGREGLFSFKAGSKVEGAAGQELFPDSVTVDHRGRVLVFGQAIEIGRQTQGPEGNAIVPTRGAVLRFEADGRLDPSFGDGKGYAIENFGIAPERQTGFPRISVMSGRVDSTNRPVFVVGADEPAPGCEGHGSVTPSPRAVVRLTSAGLSDPAFDGGGTTPIFGVGEALTFALDGRGRPVVAVGRGGSYAADCGEGSVLYRLRGDGRSMTSFGPHGKREFKTMHLAVVEPSGATILSVRRGRTLEVASVRPDGVRDRKFGHGGVARIRLPSESGLRIRPAAVDSRGRVLLAGHRRSPGSFVVGRLLPDGKLDRPFGKNGWIHARLPKGQEVSDSTAALDSKGRPPGRRLRRRQGSEQRRLRGRAISAGSLAFPAGSTQVRYSAYRQARM